LYFLVLLGVRTLANKAAYPRVFPSIPGENHEKDLGICPVFLEKRLNGVHGGVNAGRACWVVAGSLCGGKVQGSFAKKHENCEKCDFYQAVRKEEGPQYQMSIFIISKLQ